MAGIERPVTIHGIRHSFHDLARQQHVPDAVVKTMAGRSGAEVAQRGSDKHLHYSRGVTVEEMRQASIALMQLVPTESVVRPESRDRGRDGGGRDRDSDGCARKCAPPTSYTGNAVLAPSGTLVPWRSLGGIANRVLSDGYSFARPGSPRPVNAPCAARASCSRSAT
jgi:hypothetical protein